MSTVYPSGDSKRIDAGVRRIANQLLVSPDQPSRRRASHSLRFNFGQEILDVLADVSAAETLAQHPSQQAPLRPSQVAMEPTAPGDSAGAIGNVH